MFAVRGKAFGHLQLARLQSVTNVGQIGRAAQDLLHERRLALFAKFQLSNRLLEGQPRGKLTNEVQSPRRVANVPFPAFVRLETLDATFDNVRFESLGVRARGHVNDGELTAICRCENGRCSGGGGCGRRDT